MHHGAIVVATTDLSSSCCSPAAPPAAAREALGQHLIAHPVESHFEVLHACRIDDGVQEWLEHDETVDGDADGQRYGQVEALESHDAILAVYYEPNDGRHPSQNKRADDEQCCNNGLFMFSKKYSYNVSNILCSI